MKGKINMQKQKRITLNSEKRTAIANVFQSHFEREESPVMKKYYNESQIMDDGTLLESIIMELAELICVQDVIDKEEEEERKNSLPTGDPKEDIKDE